MEDKCFDVEVIYRQRVVYRVEARDREAAEEIASERWRRGERGDFQGFDWSDIETVRATEWSGDRGDTQDEQVVLRFLRERERLLDRFGADLFEPGGNDALSAEQIATDLGWVQRSGERAGPDVRRAAVTLERLCAKRKLVCFERARSRTGERGVIRLYCTPEHLERLSSGMDGVERHAG